MNPNLLPTMMNNPQIKQSIQVLEMVYLILKDENLSDFRKVRTIVDYLQENPATLPTVLSDDVIYTLLVRNFDLLLLPIAKENEKILKILIKQLCTTFLERMQAYYPVDIQSMGISPPTEKDMLDAYYTTENTIAFSEQLPNETRQKSITCTLLVLLKQNLCILPFMLMRNTTYFNLWYCVDWLDAMQAKDEKTAIFIRHALSFMVLEKADIKGLSYLKGLNLTFNPQQLNHITSKELEQLRFDTVKQLIAHGAEINPRQLEVLINKIRNCSETLSEMRTYLGKIEEIKAQLNNIKNSGTHNPSSTP